MDVMVRGGAQAVVSARGRPSGLLRERASQRATRQAESTALAKAPGKGTSLASFTQRAVTRDSRGQGGGKEGGSRCQSLLPVRKRCRHVCPSQSPGPWDSASRSLTMCVPWLVCAPPGHPTESPGGGWMESAIACMELRGAAGPEHSGTWCVCWGVAVKLLSDT